MKLWEKGINPEPAIIEFTAGKDRKTDLALTKWDIVGSMAHVIMLFDVGLIDEKEKVTQPLQLSEIIGIFITLSNTQNTILSKVRNPQ